MQAHTYIQFPSTKRNKIAIFEKWIGKIFTHSVDYITRKVQTCFHTTQSSLRASTCMCIFQFNRHASSNWEFGFFEFVLHLNSIYMLRKRAKERILHAQAHTHSFGRCQREPKMKTNKMLIKRQRQSPSTVLRPWCSVSICVYGMRGIRLIWLRKLLDAACRCFVVLVYLAMTFI